MTFWKLIRRSLRFHARSHLGVVLGAAIGSAVLIGALVVGDSVKESLGENALERLGKVYYALAPSDRLFREQLASEIEAYRKSRASSKEETAEFVPALKLQAMVGRVDGSGRANRVQLIGVDAKFAALAGGDRFRDVPPDAVIVNEVLAAQLGIKKNDMVVVRVSKPSAFTREAAISPRSDSTFALRLRVDDIAPANALGNFNLTSSQVAPHNAFVSLSMLQEKAGVAGRANMILTTRQTLEVYRNISKIELFFRSKYSVITKRPTEIHSVPTGRFVSLWGKWPFLWVCGGHWQLQDAELELRVLTNSNAAELKTSRVFLEFPVVKAALTAGTNFSLQKASPPQGLLTYFANQFRAGTNTTPYSMVTAAGAPWTPAEMRDDEIILNQWLAGDLQAKPGDEISLTYFDPESGARLVERTNTFRVRGIVPMEMPWADRTLMPDFPGIEKAESTSDWDAGFPLVHKIRPKDEDYWKKYRGTPKAFVTLAAGKKMWANRFGELTAIRFPVPTNILSEGGVARRPNSISETNQGVVELRPPATVEQFHAALEKKILASLRPEELGLRFEPVREQALKAAEQSQDFGQLFLGFSFFIIVAALVLMALLFQFGLEQRTTEIGTLLALGFTQKQVRKLLLREGIVLALIGGATGALGGIFYAKAMLHGLTTVWREAVGTSSLQFHASPKTLAIGFLASAVVATLTIWLTLRKQAKRPARELLAEGGDCRLPITDSQWRGRNFSGILAIVSSLVAAGLIGWAISKGETTNIGIFFSAGALVLVSGLGFAAAFLKSRTGILPARRVRQREQEVEQKNSNADFVGLGGLEAHPALTLTALGIRGATRRRKRSLATMAMLACGSFLIVAISAFRLDSNQNASKRSSGTGGFALIGETTMPVVHDLNAKAGKDFFALNEKDLAGVSFVPFRVREGEEASCLNLNRAQKPRLLGVKPEMLEGRFVHTKDAGWNLLRSSRRKEALTKSDIDQSLLTSAATNSDEIPAIGDANSIQWALHKKIGDTIDYTDERGNVFKLRLVGAVANSILQGSLIIDEAEFMKRFPSESGYKMFLIDTPTNRVAEVSATLSRAMEDVGLELTPATRRLNEFNAVQNTYLGTFQILGGLGLLLGSAGLGIVVLRNVLERRGELGLLVAVGFRKRALQWMLLSEHGALLGVGLGIGLVAAVVAILPSLISPPAEIPFGSVAITLGAVLLNGALWTWVATRIAVRGNLLAALRNE